MGEVADDWHCVQGGVGCVVAVWWQELWWEEGLDDGKVHGSESGHGQGVVNACQGVLVAVIISKLFELGWWLGQWWEGVR